MGISMAMGTEVVMNIGDPFYPPARTDFTTGANLGSGEFLARVLAYGIMAESVQLPSRYVLTGGVIYEALKTAPRLLRSGLVRVDRYEDLDSFEEQVRQGRYPAGALERAQWLDENCTNPVTFRPQDQGSAYHRILMADLGDGGALRRRIRGGRRGAAAPRLDRIQEEFASAPADRNKFVEVTTTHLPHQGPLFRRWAAMRYYTVPLLFDPPGMIREVPTSAAVLAAPIRSSAQRRTAHESLEESAPIGPVFRQLLRVPELERGDPAAADQVVDALLAVRERHPHARRTFHRATESAERETASDIREELRLEMARQQRYSLRAERRSRKLQWVGVGIGLGSTAAGLGLSPEISTAVGAATTALPMALEELLRRHQDRRRPWVVAHEDVSRTLAIGFSETEHRD